MNTSITYQKIITFPNYLASYMTITQFEDKDLSHFSYAVLSEESKEVILIDPSRDILPYIQFADAYGAKITGVIETHPHADFISGHLEVHKQTGAVIYCSKLLAASYPHQCFDEGDSIQLGDIKLSALSTPGHSPDSISIVLADTGKDRAVFTGDTLFIGDCGRPDLRENAGNITANREVLARQMFYSLRHKLMQLDDDVLVYPAHGAGTLCGKALSEASSSTIKAEKINNWSLQNIPEQAFIKTLTEDQPFVPKYFPYNVELNKKGAGTLSESIGAITSRLITNEHDLSQIDSLVLIIDTRPAEKFKKAHLHNSVNIMEDGKFETWLGSIVAPHEPFYLAAENTEAVDRLITRLAKIGYENFVKEALVLDYGNVHSDEFDLAAFRHNPSGYTIIDIRNQAEVKERVIFDTAINIPLPQLRERLNEIPRHKPIVIHCAAGYRSATGSSIIEEHLPHTFVYDLSTAIQEF